MAGIGNRRCSARARRAAQVMVLAAEYQVNLRAIAIV